MYSSCFGMIRCAFCLACLGLFTLATSQTIEVIDFGLENDEGSGEVFDTVVAAVTSLPTLYSSEPTLHPSPFSSSTFESAAASATSSVNTQVHEVSVPQDFVSRGGTSSSEIHGIYSTPVISIGISSVLSDEQGLSMSSSMNPEAVYASSSMNPEAVSASSSMNPEAVYASYSMNPKAVYASSSMNPEAVYASSSMDLEAVYASSSMNPEAVSASYSMNPKAVYASSSMNPEAVYASSSMDLETVYASSSMNPENTNTAESYTSELEEVSYLSSFALNTAGDTADQTFSESQVQIFYEHVTPTLQMSEAALSSLISSEVQPNYLPSNSVQTIQIEITDSAAIHASFTYSVRESFESVEESSSHIITPNDQQLIAVTDSYGASNLPDSLLVSVADDLLPATLSVFDSDDLTRTQASPTSMHVPSSANLETYAANEAKDSLLPEVNLLAGFLNKSGRTELTPSFPVQHSTRSSIIPTLMLAEDEISPSISPEFETIISSYVLPSSLLQEDSVYSSLSMESNYLNFSTTSREGTPVSVAFSVAPSSISQEVEMSTTEFSVEQAVTFVSSYVADDFLSTGLFSSYPDNPENKSSKTFSASFFQPSNSSDVLPSITPFLETQYLTTASLGNDATNMAESDSSVIPTSYLPISQGFSATTSPESMITPFSSPSDQQPSSLSAPDISISSPVISLDISSQSLSLSELKDIAPTTLIEMPLNSTGFIAMSLSTENLMTDAIMSDMSSLTINTNPLFTATTSVGITLQSMSWPQHSTTALLALSTALNWPDSETSSIAGATFYASVISNIPSASPSLPTDVNIIGTTTTVLQSSSTSSYFTTSTVVPETSRITVEPGSNPDTTAPTPVVAVLTDATFAFSFTVDRECSMLRQVPYSRQFKTSLARLLLYLTRLKSQSGSRIRIGEAHCSSKPYLISVSFFQVDKQSLLQALNATHNYHGDKRKFFSQPIEVKFSSESETFVVTITGFEEIRDFDKGASKTRILGLDTAVIATATCLCVVLICVGSCIFAREMYLKRRSDCLDVSANSSPILTFKIKTKAAGLTHTHGVYKGGKTGMDNPALCSSVYNDIEMTEVHLGDSDEDDDSSYYNPYDVEYSSIGKNSRADYDVVRGSGHLQGIMNSAYSLSSIEDESKFCVANNDTDDSGKSDVATTRTTTNKYAPRSPGNYGLVIGLLGYNRQQVQPFKQEGNDQSLQQQGQRPNHNQRKPQSVKETCIDNTVLEENIYAVPMKYPKKSRKNSRKRPSLQVVSDPRNQCEPSVPSRAERGKKASPVPPPRRHKQAAHGSRDEHRLADSESKSGAGRSTSGAVQRSISGDEDANSPGLANTTFLEDEGYAVISSSTQSFHF